MSIARPIASSVARPIVNSVDAVADAGGGVDTSYADLVATAVHRWTLDGTPNDSGTSPTNMTWVGTPAYSTFTPASPKQAANLSGTLALTSVATNSDTEFTFACWWKQTTAPSGAITKIFGRGVDGSFSHDHSSGAYADSFIFHDGAWNNTLALSSSQGVWIHLAATFSDTGNVAKLYRNAVEVTPGQTLGALGYGAFWGIGEGGVEGDVAECMYFDSVLSQADITTLYSKVE